MSLYKLTWFISNIIKTKWLDLHCYQIFFNQLYCVIVRKDCDQDKNLSKSSNKSK